MSECPPPLPRTLERLDARIAEQGPERGDVLAGLPDGEEAER
ncbi:hypothetical protein [Streptomyces sp. NPDC005141]